MQSGHLFPTQFDHGGLQVVLHPGVGFSRFFYPFLETIMQRQSVPYHRHDDKKVEVDEKHKHAGTCTC